jgi:parallel beta-helix repeat protein
MRTQRSPRKFAKVALLLIVVSAVSVLGYVTLTNRYASVKGCSELIFTDGTTTYAQNCETGRIDYTGTETATVFNSAISNLKNGGTIFVKAGEYVVSSQISLDQDSIILRGEGFATVFQATSDPSTILSIHASNVLVADLKVDASAQIRGQNGLGIVVRGQNITLNGVWVYGADHNDLRIDGGKYVTVTNGRFTDAYNDGVVVAGTSEHVIIANNIVVGNSPDMAAGNQISLVGPAEDITITSNAIGNPPATVHQGACISLENLGSGPVTRIQISSNECSRPQGPFVNIYKALDGVASATNVNIVGNIVASSQTAGVILQSGARISIEGNQIINATSGPEGSGYGVWIPDLGNVDDVAIGNNLIDSPQLDGIYIGSGNNNVAVTGNRIQFSGQRGIQTLSNSTLIADNRIVFTSDPSASNLGIVLNGAHGSVVSGNLIRYPYSGILVTGSNNTAITGNQITGVTGNRGIEVRGNSRWFAITGNDILGAPTPSTMNAGVLINAVSQANGIISSNVITGSTTSNPCIRLYNGVTNTTVIGNTVGLCSCGIMEDTGGSDYNLIAYNYIVGPTVQGIYTIGTHTRVFENMDTS